MAEEMRKGLGRMSKAPDEDKGGEKPMPKGKVDAESHGEADGEEGTSTITHHADGSHTSQMHGGEETHHPDHKHLMAHIGHHLSGGDAHHVTHHDGMEAHSHTVHEDGTHEPHEGDPHESLDAMMNGGMGDQTGGDNTGDHEMMDQHPPTYGGM